MCATLFGKHPEIGMHLKIYKVVFEFEVALRTSRLEYWFETHDSPSLVKELSEAE